MAQTAVNEAQIRESAYQLWLDEGQPEGRDQELWFRAEELLKKPAKKTARKPAAKKATAASKSAPKKAAAKPAAKKASKAKTVN